MKVKLGYDRYGRREATLQEASHFAFCLSPPRCCNWCCEYHIIMCVVVARTIASNNCRIRNDDGSHAIQATKTYILHVQLLPVSPSCLLLLYCMGSKSAATKANPTKTAPTETAAITAPRCSSSVWISTKHWLKSLSAPLTSHSVTR